MFKRRHRPIHYRPHRSALGWGLTLAVVAAALGGAGWWTYSTFGGVPSLQSVMTLTQPAAPREPPRVGLFSGPAEAEGPTVLRFEAASVTLHGIEPPGPNITCASGDCGASARVMLGRVIGRRDVLCVARARSDGRVFATCYLPDGGDLAAALVARGWAVAAPDTSYYRSEEERARAAAVGIWALATAAEPAPAGEGATPATAAASTAPPDEGGFVPPDD